MPEILEFDTLEGMSEKLTSDSLLNYLRANPQQKNISAAELAHSFKQRPQKVTRMLQKMVKDGSLEKVQKYGQRTAVYKLAESSVIYEMRALLGE